MKTWVKQWLGTNVSNYRYKYRSQLDIWKSSLSFPYFHEWYRRPWTVMLPDLVQQRKQSYLFLEELLAEERICISFCMCFIQKITILLHIWIFFWQHSASCLYSLLFCVKLSTAEVWIPLFICIFGHSVWDIIIATILMYALLWLQMLGLWSYVISFGMTVRCASVLISLRRILLLTIILSVGLEITVTKVSWP